MLVDAVGVTRKPKVDAGPLEQHTEKDLNLEKLLRLTARGVAEDTHISTLASRLAKLDLQMTDDERAEIEGLTGGVPLKHILHKMVDAVSIDEQGKTREAAERLGLDPDQAVKDVTEPAPRPLASNPELRTRLLEMRRAKDILYDETSRDALVSAGAVPQDESTARETVRDWQAYVKDHRDEMAALAIAFSAQSPVPPREALRRLKDLARAVARPPRAWTADKLWRSYEQVGEAVTANRSAARTAADLLALLRYELEGGADGRATPPRPHAEAVEERYAAWLTRQDQAGVAFTDTERWWLDRIAEATIQRVRFDTADLDYAPFTKMNGTDGFLAEFGEERAEEILDELDRELGAVTLGLGSDSGDGGGGFRAGGGGELPRGWSWATLEELCDVNPRAFNDEPGDDDFISQVPMASVEAETGRIDASNHVRFGDLKKKSLTRFQENDVLFAKITPCMENGKIAVARGLLDGRALGSTEFHVLRSRGAVLPEDRSPTLLQPDVRTNAEQNMSGAVGQRRVPRPYLESLAVPVAPLAEQQRIVAEIEQQIAHIEAGEAAAHAALSSATSLAEQITARGSRGCLEEVELAPAPLEKADIDDGAIPDLPVDWSWARLCEVASVVGGVTKDSKRQGEPNYVEVPYLRVANVQRGQLVLDNVTTIRVPPEKALSLRLQPGDILLNEGGDQTNLGAVGCGRDRSKTASTRTMSSAHE